MLVLKKDILLFAFLLGLIGLVVLFFATQDGEFYQSLTCPIPSPFETQMRSGSTLETFKYRLKNPKKNPKDSGNIEPKSRELRDFHLVDQCGQGRQTSLNCHYRKQQVKPGTYEIEDLPESQVKFLKICPWIELLWTSLGPGSAACVVLFVTFIMAVIAADKGYVPNLFLNRILPISAGLLYILAGLGILSFARMTLFGAYTCRDGQANYEKEKDPDLRTCKREGLSIYRTDWLMTAASFPVLSGILCISSVFKIIAK